MKLNTDRLKLELRRSRKPFGFLVILVVIAGAATGGIAKNITFSRPWQDYREVKVEFKDVKGIFPGGHQVRINGVKVGVVSKSALDKNRAVLTMKIEEKFGPVYRDAKVRIRPVTPLQDLYVNITDRGTPARGEAGGDYVIPQAQTVTPVDVSRVLNTFNGPTRERMAILLSEFGKGLDDQGDQLKETFVQLAPFLNVAEDATRVLNRRQTNVRRLVTNFGRVSQSLAERDRELNRFVTEGNKTLGELARNDAPLAGTFNGLAELLPVMRSSFASVEGLSGELDPALKSLEPVAEELERGLGGLQKFGTDAVPAFRALRPAARSLRTMARTLEPTSKVLDTSFARLRRQAPQYDRITANLVPCLTTIQAFFQNTLSVLKYSNASGAYPRAENASGADSSPLDNGNAPDLRRLPQCTDKIGG